MTYEEIRRDHAVQVYIAQADETLRALGFTEHSFAHVTKVAETAGDILKLLGHSHREVELAKIAGYLHDIGNVVNRVDHSQSGAAYSRKMCAQRTDYAIKHHASADLEDRADALTD